MEGKTPNPAIEMSKPGDGPTESLVKALEKKCPANSGTYYDFVEALKDFTAQRTDAAAFMRRLDEVFDGHGDSHLDDFLPPSPLPSITTTEKYQSASQFLDKLKARLGDDDQFHHFCKVFNRCNRRHPASRAQFANWARSLIGEDLDLLREFNQYFPYDF